MSTAGGRKVLSARRAKGRKETFSLINIFLILLADGSFSSAFSDYINIKFKQHFN